jgi:dipeptidase E
MKQKLILTSSGIEPELREVFIDNLTKDPSEVSIAFVTTAGYGETKNPTWIDKDKDLLRQCGIRKIFDLDLKDKTQDQLERELATADVILVEGGNTFYLLYHARKSGFDNILPKLLSEGKLYVGISAGSYIPCPTVEAATWKHADRNKVGLKDLTGFNLVPFLITAHFEEGYRTIVEQASRNTKYPIVTLRDGQAILVEGSNYKLVGKGDKNFFNGFNEKWRRKSKS